MQCCNNCCKGNRDNENEINSITVKNSNVNGDSINVNNTDNCEEKKDDKNNNIDTNKNARVEQIPKIEKKEKVLNQIKKENNKENTNIKNNKQCGRLKETENNLLKANSSDKSKIEKKEASRDEKSIIQDNSNNGIDLKNKPSFETNINNNEKNIENLKKENGNNIINKEINRKNINTIENISNIKTISNDIVIDDNISKICAKAIDIYPAILDRISSVELYYLCENFIERDKYNSKKRSENATALKLVSFAKGECADKKDIKELKQNKDNSFFTKQHQNNNKLEKIGQGVEKTIFSINKQDLFETKHQDKKIVFAVEKEKEQTIQKDAYNAATISQKILLSLFARQTKYYTTFMMKEIKQKNGKKRNQKQYDNEKNKEMARQLFFRMWDHDNLYEYNIKIDDFYKTLLSNKNNNTQYKDVKHNILFDDNSKKNIYIDLQYLEAVDLHNFIDMYNLLQQSTMFKLKNIHSNFKKLLTINPKLIVFHTLMELKKYDFPHIAISQQMQRKEKNNDFIQTKESLEGELQLRTIIDNLTIYKNLLIQAKKNFEKIKDNDGIVTLCDKQIKIYNKYLENIQKYTKQDFEKDYDNECNCIETSINKYRSLCGVIKGTAKKTGPLLFLNKECNNSDAKNQSTLQKQNLKNNIND